MVDVGVTEYYGVDAAQVYGKIAPIAFFVFLAALHQATFQQDRVVARSQHVQ